MEDPRVKEFSEWLVNQEKKKSEKAGTSTDDAAVLPQVIGPQNTLRAIRDLIDTANTSGTTRGLKTLFDRRFRIFGGDK